MRRILALFLPVLLLVTACGGGSGDASSSDSASAPSANAESLASVQVEDKGAGQVPGVTFDKPLTLSAESVKVVSEGSGAEVAAGQSVALRAVGFNVSDGESTGNNFSDPAGEKMIFDEAFASANPIVYDTFVGATVGSFVAYGYPAVPAVPATATSAEVPEQPATLTVFLIESASDVAAPLTQPEGESVTPPAGLPTVAEADGKPVITIGDAAAPTALVAQDLITGTGAVLTGTETIVANYVGVNFVGGNIFDSSFDRGTPATFPLTGVIPGWTQGLTGKSVGSRVLLVIPKDLAYGDAGQGEASGDLVFVVDILGVQ